LHKFIVTLNFRAIAINIGVTTLVVAAIRADSINSDFGRTVRRGRRKSRKTVRRGRRKSRRTVGRRRRESRRTVRRGRVRHRGIDLLRSSC